MVPIEGPGKALEGDPKLIDFGQTRAYPWFSTKDLKYITVRTHFRAKMGPKKRILVGKNGPKLAFNIEKTQKKGYFGFKNDQIEFLFGGGGTERI